MDLIRVECAHLDDFLHFHHRNFAGRNCHRVEIARRLAKNQVAVAVRLPGLGDGEIALDGLLQNVMSTVELSHFLALTYRRTVAGGRIKRRDTGTAGTHLLRQRALRGQFHLEFATHHLRFEQGILAHVGGHHFANLFIDQ